MPDDRNQRLAHELSARRAATKSARDSFLKTIEDSDDVDDILKAARGHLEASGELKAIELAEQEMKNVSEYADLGVGYKRGFGAAGRLEAARRFGKDARR